MTVWGHLATRLVPDAALRWGRTPAHPATPATPPDPRPPDPRPDVATRIAAILDHLGWPDHPCRANPALGKTVDWQVLDVLHPDSSTLDSHTNAKACPTCGRKA